MSDTLITIGITCYREGDLLRECWESVLAQTDDRWVAVIVMDGGADEKTRELFASIEHPKVVKKFAFEENVGPYPVRNKAFELTETPYHFYLDGDDMLPPGCIAAMYRTFEAHPDAAYVYGDYVGHPCGRLIRTPKAMYDPGDVLAFAAGCGLYRVDAWRILGGFPGAFARGGGDTDFRISLYEAGLPHYHCGDLFYVYRVGDENSVSSRRQSTFADVGIAIFLRHPVFFAGRRVRHQFLAHCFSRTIYSHLMHRRKAAALRYVAKGFRWLGIFDRDLWLWIPKVLLGREGMDVVKAFRQSVLSHFERSQHMGRA
ncbi:MAG TPA: glycosyltransferase family A protein [Candidatus Latescibacteria bacterium]|nr:glycosyltransferase family A protein [Candidatus Latescibacterota bacterium]HOS64365.1 glycosyltransferase family A protein [Candidatus Latescibacterota bacterium]HPK75782.1 glycosyltransferase family A protein [Candidatus Latescibacterota bacterium]